ncbi:SymE family type I addiction module toxin [Glaciimonas sp. PAMC28666]|uniref:SymE family type I addiction module toxin n=1 Tax=Glaciimonas sp. PAMC28666 TaxID=2807626 RepID=UPI0019657FF3|nr:type I toxin-antitoxin system SymE family toxin [Glaciimonas sp. PAMC28666]QRX81627.1 type I toxin-antitoxin system SymE family toxin [Glaciimonas sp. PAMC28666]
MAKPNHTRDSLAPTNSHTDRFLTVSLYPEPQPHVPWIRLRGLWLKQAGFTAQTKIKVQVMTDRLVITRV